ncbi:MAG: hypothetical protein GTO02_22355 [Candidatus Dadabacteria bacterium]|nr:hypothetical protein [Candidatus Dadabacteria bacterium]
MSKSDQIDVDVDELEDLKSDLEYFFSDLNSDLQSSMSKLEDLENRIDDIGDGELSTEFSRLKGSFEDLLYAEDALGFKIFLNLFYSFTLEFAELSDCIENLIDENQGDEEDE